MQNSDCTIYRTENVLRYFRDIEKSKFDPLEDSVIRDLFSDRNKNREQIINSNIRLVATIAKSYDNEDKFMDFNQEGIEGLMEAIDKYDPNQKSKFSSYAAYWIKAKMSMLCKEFNMVQRSNQGVIGSKATKFREQFLKEHAREATTNEIIEHLSENHNIDVKYDNEIYDISVNSIDSPSIDKDINESAADFGEFATKTASQNDYLKEIEREDLSNSIGQMMSILTDKEREFITRHIYNGDSYADIAEDFGYTSERVRQIVMSGLKKMKNSEVAKTRFACYLK